MKTLKKHLHTVKIRFETIHEMFGFLRRQSHWWLMPIIFILLFVMLFLFVTGHTGTAAFIYPLF